jgi:hypothetical protein
VAERAELIVSESERRVISEAPLLAPREPLPHVCVCGRPQAMIRQLAEAMGLNLPAIAATPAQVWEALLCEVERKVLGVEHIVEPDGRAFAVSKRAVACAGCNADEHDRCSRPISEEECCCE